MGNLLLLKLELMHYSNSSLTSLPILAPKLTNSKHSCEREGVTKRVFLYQQHRFAKLGKAAASILNAKDILSMLLDEVQVTNQLTESCKIYLASDLFLMELECLAYCNHFVTFPFLNCVEVSTRGISEYYPKTVQWSSWKKDRYIGKICS